MSFDDAEGEFSKFDRLLEERFDHDLGEDDLGLLDEDDGFNDETFGDAVTDIKGKEFDFGAKPAKFEDDRKPPKKQKNKKKNQPQQQQQQPQPQSSSIRPRPQQPQIQMNVPQQQRPLPMQMPAGAMLTVEQLEAQMRMQAQNMYAPPPPQFMRPMPGFMMPQYGPGGVPPFAMGPPPPMGHMGMPPPGVMSVAELEASFLSQRQQQQPMQPFYGQMRPELPAQHAAVPPPVVAPLEEKEPPLVEEPKVVDVPKKTERRAKSNKKEHPAPTDTAAIEEGQLSEEEYPRLGHEAPQPRPRPSTAASGAKPNDQSQQNPVGQEKRRKGKQVIMSTNRQQQRGSGQDRDNQNRRGNLNDQLREYKQREMLFSHIRISAEGFDGLMSVVEKENIAKMQLAQLVSDNPDRDDFYYQTYKTIKSEENKESPAEGAAPSGTGPAKGKRWKETLMTQATHAETGNNLTKHLRHQMQRLIEGKKQKQKDHVVALEGALGKISLTTNKNPRQAIQVNIAPAKHKNAHQPDTKLSRTDILRSVENVYERVLNLEYLTRHPPKDDQEAKEEWENEFDENLLELWTALQVDEPIPYSAQHPTPSILSFSKGAKVLSRALAFFTPDRQNRFFLTVLNRVECVEACHAILGQENERVESFMINVIPSLVRFISETSLSTINDYIRLLLERHSMTWLTKSKVGLAILTMLLSRAEILKQGSERTDAELAVWTDLYNYLFQSLQGKFKTVFPSSHVDEVYAWQFLSAIAVGASTIDHQRVLVTEVREQVIETAKRGDEKGMRNVDLFLNALGLNIDAQQLASMPL